MRSRAFAFAVVLFSLATSTFAAYRQAAWVPSWDSNALTSMQVHAGSLDESNPGWYVLDANGNVTKSWNAENPSLRAALTGTRLIPMIQNYVNGGFDAGVVGKLIATPESREAHASALASLVNGNAFDGIDIDYEELTPAMKSNFSAFISLLGQKLHASNKKLSVTLGAKTSDTQDWAGPGGNDWPSIGAAADWIKVMAYDKHYPGGSAGAIAPLDWLDNVVTYSETHAPASKIMIGLPWYGYDWSGTNAVGVTYASGMQSAQAHGVTPTRDVSGELTFTYSGRVVFFQDATSYAMKVDSILAKHKNIAGFAHWRAGAEDPDTWTKVAAIRGGSTSTPPPSTTPPPPTPDPGNGSGGTPAQTDFLVTGPELLNVTAGGSAQSSFSISPINNFAEDIAVTTEKIDAIDASIAVSKSTVRASQATTLTVSPSRNVPAGTYRIRVRFQSSRLMKDAIVAVTVTAPPASKSRAARH